MTDSGCDTSSLLKENKLPLYARSHVGPRLLPLLLVAGLAGPAWTRPIYFGRDGFTYTLSNQQACFRKTIETRDFPSADLQTVLEQLKAAKDPHGYLAKAAAEVAEALKKYEYASVEEKQPKVESTKSLDDSTLSSSSSSSSSSTSSNLKMPELDPIVHGTPGITKLKLFRFGPVKGLPRLPMLLDDSGRTLKFIGVSLDWKAITAMDGDGNDVALARVAAIREEDDVMRGNISEFIALGKAVKAAEALGNSNYIVTGEVHTDRPVSLFLDADGTIDFTTSEAKLWRIPKQGNLQCLGPWGQGTESNQFGGRFLCRDKPWEIFGLAGGPEGVRFIADALENRIYRVTLSKMGEAKFEIIAGNGAKFTGDTEAMDATKVGLTPMGGITVDKKGIVTFVEFADQGVRALTPNHDGTYSLRTVMEGHRGCDSGHRSFWNQILKAIREKKSSLREDPVTWMRKIALGPDEELLVVDNYKQTITDTAAKVTRKLGDLGTAFKNDKDLRIGHFGRVPGGLLFQVWRKTSVMNEESEVFLASTQLERAEAELPIHWVNEALKSKSYDEFIKLKQNLADSDPDPDFVLQQLSQHLPLDLGKLTLAYMTDPSRHWRVKTLLRELKGKEKEFKDKEKPL